MNTVNAFIKCKPIAETSVITEFYLVITYIIIKHYNYHYYY